jgi:hypothetical protein
MDNIKMNLKNVGCEDMDWIHLAHVGGPVVGSYEHGNESSKGMSLLNACNYLSPENAKVNKADCGSNTAVRL